MRLLRRGALLVLLSLTFSISIPSDLKAFPAYPGEYVVTVPPQTRSHSMAALGASSLEDYAVVIEQIRGGSVVVSRNMQSRRTSAPAALSFAEQEGDLCKELLSKGVVDSCSPNYKLTVSQVAHLDPLYSSLWGLNDDEGIGASSAWSITTGSSDVVVAVIDTGIDYTHEDLAANIWVNPGEIPGNGIDDDGNGYVDDVHGVNLTVGARTIADPMDDNQHGTHVAGTIGAVHNNGIGLRGVSDRVRLLPIKFMDASGSGRLSDAIAAIDYMVDLKLNHGVNIKVSNNSWGGGGYSVALENAIKRARDAGILFVVAAGNDGTDVDQFPSYPGSYEVENIIRVAAVDSDQNLANFSNYGALGVDIAAPGVNIVSTLPGQQYGSLSGTSMAAPHVAGSLALLFSLFPAIGMSDAIERLLETGRELVGLSSPDGSEGYVRSRRLVHAKRLLTNERVPLSRPIEDVVPCGYSFQVSNLAGSGALDDAADRLNPINQVDEGDYRVIQLPFEFPFFRTTTRTIYVSPNGLVYLHQPQGADYQVGRRPPNNSIAAFHSDLIPRSAKHGVRAFIGGDRVVISWLSEHYSLAGQGPIAVRLTLYRSGLIRSTISFESARDPVSLSWLTLGNGLVSPPISSLGIIGASAASSSFSSTVDIAAAQRELNAKTSQQLDLGIAMVPNCFSTSPNTPPEQELQIARVDQITTRQITDTQKILVQLLGAGSGKVPVQAYVNGKECSNVAWSSMLDGMARFRLAVPPGVRRLKLLTTNQNKLVRIKSSLKTRRRQKHSRMCRQLLRRVR